MHNTLRIIAVVLIFFIALPALAAGYSFIVDPSGKGVDISLAYLKSTSPFKNYFIPGIVLFTVNGILSVVIAIAVLKKVKHYPFLILLQGFIYIGWIAVQLTMVRSFHPFHAIVASIGIVLMFIGWILYRVSSEDWKSRCVLDKSVQAKTVKGGR